jgi:FAD/FMN-containing dehydrogenase/Fe-S oxidoreductase
VRGLERGLREAVRGEVRFDALARGTWSTDASNYRQVPLGVVLPRDTDDLEAALAVCRDYGAPITPRGGGTSLAGQAVNDGVVLDTSRYLNRVLELDPDGRWARVEPGCVLDDLRAAADRVGLTFGPDPATHDRCTLGGMIGNNSCGVHSAYTGRTSDNVDELDVLLYDGTRLTVGPTSPNQLARLVASSGRPAQIYRELASLADRYGDLVRERYPQIPRRVSGYNLDELLPEHGFQVARALVGSEGTCVTVLSAKVALADQFRGRSLVVAGFPGVAEAADRVPALLAHRPIGLEGTDARLFTYSRGQSGWDRLGLPPAAAYLVVELGGDTGPEAAERGRLVVAELSADGIAAVALDDPADQRQVWAAREAAVGTASRLPGGRDAWPGWEDSAVPPDRLGSYLRGFERLLEGFGYSSALYGHFGQGCVHARIDFELGTERGVTAYRRFLEEAAELVVAHGGSLSGEHGDGQQRGPLLARMFGEELVQAFREFKAVWDPTGRMNPGKVVDPVGELDVDENLRVGPSIRLSDPTTRFRFPEDDGRLSRAVLRCVGVGSCRRGSGGTMCPSYMVTRKEEHSTRGRARLLYEMLEGQVVQRGWRSKEVKESLDLCLACKGCRRECPAGVDMATYKAEFLSHHYRGRLRPRPAYAMGPVGFWVKAASALRLAPLANALTRAAGPALVLRRLAGLAPERPLPSLARRTFRAGFRSRAGAPEGVGAEAAGGSRAAPPGGGGPGVIRGSRGRVALFCDTFTNYFQPEVGHAAVSVLEAAGFEVLLPERDVCCGRPLYDYGMLHLARRQLSRLVSVLSPLAEAGCPIVVLEPSCLATFRDELLGMLPDDPRARRLAERTVTLSGLLEERAPDWAPAPPGGRVLVAAHCHQRATVGLGAEEELLSRLGADFEVPDTGCCGLAGSFGYEADKYDVSMACGERALFPRVREAGSTTAVVADGFSCRSQIAHGTGRQAIHLAQLLEGQLRG